jgi:hypothetical protein
MIGVASECVVLEVRDCLCARLDILQKPRAKELTHWKLKTVLDGIEKQIAPKKKDMPQALYERFDSYWPAFTQQIRTVRNESGHAKSIDAVTQETVHASLLIFPELIFIAKDLMDWINVSYS